MTQFVKRIKDLWNKFDPERFKKAMGGTLLILLALLIIGGIGIISYTVIALLFPWSVIAIAIFLGIASILYAFNVDVD